MSNGKLSHEDINLLLPWYLNGTLEGDELDTVKRHISQCAPCAREVEELNLIRSAIAESNEKLNEMLSVPVGDMERNIMDRISVFENSRETKTAAPRPYERESLWSKVAGFFDRFTVLSTVPAGAIALIVLQFALIVGLAAKLSFEKPEGYEVLSGVTKTDGKGPIIFVAFQESATEKEIRETLGQIGGRIVDGPKEGGLYIVDLPDKLKPGVTVDTVIEGLKSKPGVIKDVLKGGD
jgi:hypothetical protein